jgi:hypothetical protein
MEFQCSKCFGIFDKISDGTWNDFKAAEELLTNHPESKNDPTDILCDDCYELFKRWFATLTDEDKKRMREEFENERSRK